jgi:hypothetical protein
MSQTKENSLKHSGISEKEKETLSIFRKAWTWRLMKGAF